MGQKPAGVSYLFLLLILLVLSSVLAEAQRVRVTGPVDNSRRAALANHIHPNVRPENDRGRMDAARLLQHLTIILKRSDAQEADLTAFLARQQDPSSPDYHRWLRPEQYAERFGVAQADLDRIVEWLNSQNLKVVSVARARNAVAFTGTVRQIEAAFQTELHKYTVNGEDHFANASAPSVPNALTGVIGAIHGLNDFRLKPQKRTATTLPRPAYTSATTGNHYLAPDDIATIYDILPLYNNGVTGDGQKIAVVGQTQINVSDIQQFRSYFGLPPSDPQITLVPNTRDPGTSTEDLGEADLDIEWSGAIARKASILYVYSYDVTDAVQYVVDQNLAPIISMSYGLCEAQTGNADLAALRALAQQASAQGITWINASGDSGANDCYSTSSRVSTGAGVDAPASVPEVTGIGGTTFTEGSGVYWNTSNSATQSSALSTIPETAWNDSIADGSPSSSGGGMSALFEKPSWQTGAGVPADGARDVPDISLAASARHDPYLIYSEGRLQLVGGTSVGTPVFAGIAALLNHYLVANGFQPTPGLGNMNPRLYSLAASAPAAFRDVTTGDNVVTTCPSRSRACTSPDVGYPAGPGYDLATGLGSIDAYNLVTAWHQTGTAVKASAALNVTSSVSTIPQSGSAVLTATVTSSNGTTPTGSVTWSIPGVTLGTGNLAGSGNSASAALTVSASQLSGGALSITAVYSGDAVFNSSAAAVSVTVTDAPGTLSIRGLTSAASFKALYAPGMIMAIFGTQFTDSTLSSPTVPLATQLGGVSVTVNGIAAPLYYVSPTQLNVQIPYEIPANTTAVVKVTSNGQSATSAITINPAEPAIFTDTNGAPVPNQTAHRGETVTLFITGDGAATPQPVTGSTPAPATTPRPFLSTSVTVAGVVAPPTFVGIPSWSVGVTQINYTVPLTAPVGVQPVVVNVGGIPSAAVNLTVLP